MATKPGTGYSGNPTSEYNPYGFVPSTTESILSGLSPDDLEKYENFHPSVQKRFIDKRLRQELNAWNKSNPDKMIYTHSGTTEAPPKEWGYEDTDGGSVSSPPTYYTSGGFGVTGAGASGVNDDTNLLSMASEPTNPGLFGKEDGFGSGKGWLARTFGGKPGNLVEGIDSSGSGSSIGDTAPGTSGMTGTGDMPGTGTNLLTLSGSGPRSINFDKDGRLIPKLNPQHSDYKGPPTTVAPTFDDFSEDRVRAAEDRFVEGKHVWNKDLRGLLTEKYKDPAFLERARRDKEAGEIHDEKVATDLKNQEKSTRRKELYDRAEKRFKAGKHVWNKELRKEVMENNPELVEQFETDRQAKRDARQAGWKKFGKGLGQGVKHLTAAALANQAIKKKDPALLRALGLFGTPQKEYVPSEYGLEYDKSQGIDTSPTGMTFGENLGTTLDDIMKFYMFQNYGGGIGGGGSADEGIVK